MRVSGRMISLVGLMTAVCLMVSACGAGKEVAPASAPERQAQGGAAPAEAPTAPPEKAKLVMAIGGAECLCYLPTTLAYQLGYFKAEGLDVDLQDLKGGSKALEALLGGSADVVSGYYEHTIRMQVKGKQISSFVNFAQYPGLALVVSKQAQDRIKSVKDLKGAKVGVTAPGSSTQAMANYLLSKEGLKPTDISVVGIGLGATAVAAIEHGAVDAAILPDPAVTQLQNRGSVKVLVDTRTEADTVAVFGKSGATAGSLYATTDFLSKYPNTTQHLTNAILKALHYIATHSAEEIAAQMPESYYGGDKDLYVAALKMAMPGYSRDGLFAPGAAQSTFDMLVVADDTIRAAKDQVKLNDTFANTFVQKAPKIQ